MSQSEINALLYGALSSGSTVCDNDNEMMITQVLVTQDDVDAIIGFAPTPNEVIAHYDFRVRTAR
jgi:hypothetical protein